MGAAHLPPEELAADFDSSEPPPDSEPRGQRISEPDSNFKDEEETPVHTVPPTPPKQAITRPYKPFIPYPQRLRQDIYRTKYNKFLEIMKTVNVQVPFT